MNICTHVGHIILSIFRSGNNENCT